MIQLFGYAMALLTGLSLGMMGSGGSILTVPVLVYLFRMNPIPATAYSLFIVGLTSLVGLASRLKEGKVDLFATAYFAFPSLIGVFLVRKYVVHALPEVLSAPWAGSFTRQTLIMGAFGAVMLAASISMLFATAPRWGPQAGAKGKSLLELPMLGLEGFLVGGVTGFVGAGGGFLIVPAMILLGRLSIETAIGTSLAIITVQSIAGFLTDLTILDSIRWPFLLAFSLLSIAGVLAGGRLGHLISAEKLKKSFGWFTLIIALVILGHELILRGRI